MLIGDFTYLSNVNLYHTVCSRKYLNTKIADKNIRFDQWKYHPQQVKF